MVITLNTAKDEETIFFKNPVKRLLKLGNKLLIISELLSWKIFFCRYSIIRYRFWFRASIIVGNSTKKFLNWIDNIGKIKKHKIKKIK